MSLPSPSWNSLPFAAASTSSSITINYSVFDPNSEYDVVFIKLTGSDDNDKTYYLSKNNTSFLISDLTPDTEYSLKFGYKTNKANVDIIEDEIIISTKRANYDIHVDKISTKLTKVGEDEYRQMTIAYTLKVDLNYKFKTAKVVFSSNGEELASETLSNDTSANDENNGIIITDMIGEDGIYKGVLVLERNVGIADNSVNILSLKDIMTCKSEPEEGEDACSLDNNLKVNYKFYNN